ncbi:5-(carboxyamino)imidazole ribonucleotide synthase [Dermatobacter hominis]|uniref:5-(carboxyamino)imidazole ribonucleotide synthase n=1 Tax=Dermatobacter hominis TaxID=2884263 RepID=UPI001D113292|nr:5-(carboxyamino)imidazole ribonucleotide synthase [Dermatobacter hominis]UDY34103.1 5-(carboxyamino)imidazole ribonucleotide synthase [Dermatobacter hominis]
MTAAPDQAPAVTGPVVGIVGGGQLARMLAEAATPMGIHVRVLAGPADEGAGDVVPDTVVADVGDADALRAFARSVDVLTFDHENVDHDVLLGLEAEGVAVRPSVATLRYSDKAHQRRRFAEAGIPVPEFVVLDGGPDDVAAAEAFAAAHGGVAVVKASRGGYDGRGVWMLAEDEVGAFVRDWTGAPLVLEPRLDLVVELAVLAARRPSGEVAAWPVVETVQVDGMCDEVLLPAPVDDGLAARARAVGERVAQEVGATGVIAVELFVVPGDDGPLVMVNEIAPRVHNSGHMTIEASTTSQFAQHLRAVLDWPLGPTDCVEAAAMANVVGDGEHDPRDRQPAALAAEPGAHVHLYGKAPRPGRKIGHVTVVADDVGAARRRAAVAADVLAGSGSHPTGTPSGLEGSAP